MSKLDDMKAKAKDLVTENRDRIEDGLEKAGNLVNQKTGGKHEEKIDKGLAKAREGLDKAEGKEGDDGPPMATGPAEPPQPTTPPPGPPMG